MELRELRALREDAAAFADQRARAELALASGTGRGELPSVWVRAHPRAASAEGLAELSDALGEAQAATEPKPGRVARLSALRWMLMRARAIQLDPAAADALWLSSVAPTVQLAGDAGLHGPQPPVVVARRLPWEPSRRERARLQAAMARAAEALLPAARAGWDAELSALAELRLGDPRAAALRLHGAQGEGWADPASICAGLLRDTDALFHDLGGWLIERRTEAELRGDAELHDLEFVLATAGAAAFPAGELVRTVRRWAEGLRLDPGFGGLVRLEDEDRPLKAKGARAFACEGGDEVRVSLLPERGAGALAAALGALSVAGLRASTPGDAPPEDSRGEADPALPIACAALLENLVLEEGFLRRCAKADLGVDERRAMALSLLVRARLAAGCSLAALEALGRGLSEGAEAAASEHLRAALGVEVPRAFAARGLDPWLSAWSELRGLALAARLREHLRDRCDEDFYRNPRALPRLQALWGRGGRPTGPELWRELWAADGGASGSATEAGADAAPSLAPLLRQLRELCG